MERNPRVQLIDICMPVQEWTAIPESKASTFSCSSNKMNQPLSPKCKNKTAKKIHFTFNTLRKNWSRRKQSQRKNDFCPFLPILNAAAEILLTINSKHPTQKLGLRETLGFARYRQARGRYLKTSLFLWALQRRRSVRGHESVRLLSPLPWENKGSMFRCVMLVHRWFIRWLWNCYASEHWLDRKRECSSERGE